MSVIGIDFGTESCYIAVARQGGIETIANDYSLRSTPSVVAFTGKNRIMGVAAKNQTTTNMKNTIMHFKHFVGRKFRDSCVQTPLQSLPYTMVETPGGGVGIKVNYQSEDRTFTPTEITSMLFTKLKILAETALEIKVNDVVIGVPSYFDDMARHALLSAAQGAGLNVLRLFNETAATALAYGIYKQDLPAAEEKPRNVIFVDAGYSSMQVFAVAFNKGKLKVLATTFDSDLGGRNFDRIIANHFVEMFKKQYKVDASTNKKAYTKLLSEVEKLKKQMSANSTQLPVNIECFMDDKDVSGRMSRTEFEDLAGDCFDRIEATLSSCLQDSQLKLDDIHSVEIVGGSSRVPAIKRLIEKVFKQTSSTTLNQDEAVARGCALQCAMLSPTFKVREFSIQDVQTYGIRLLWRDEGGQEGDMEVFPKNHQVPFSKLLTFFRRAPFSLQAEYNAPSPTEDKIIGNYSINDVAPNAEGSSQKVKVKVRVNLHGNFLVASASLTKKEDATAQVEEQEEPPMETDDKKAAGDAAKAEDAAPKEGEAPPAGDAPPPRDAPPPPREAPPPPAADASENGEAPKTSETEVKDPAKLDKKAAAAKKSRSVELPVETRCHAPTPQQLNALVESESTMAAADRLENDRINAKNAVEEYVYDLRSKMCEELEKFVSEEETTAISRELEATEDWLYGDGEDCHKQVYIDKLDSLKKQGEPPKERRRERMELPKSFETLMRSIQLAKKVCDQFRADDEKFVHLDGAEVEKVEKAVLERLTWAEQQMGSVKATSNFQTVPITCHQVRSEMATFEALVKPIINKPKPKPKAATPPPVETTPEEEEEEGAAAAPAEDAKTGEEATPQANGPTDAQTKDPAEQPMDVD